LTLARLDFPATAQNMIYGSHFTLVNHERTRHSDNATIPQDPLFLHYLQAGVVFDQQIGKERYRITVLFEYGRVLDRGGDVGGRRHLAGNSYFGNCSLGQSDAAFCLVCHALAEAQNANECHGRHAQAGWDA